MPGDGGASGREVAAFDEEESFVADARFNLSTLSLPFKVREIFVGSTGLDTTGLGTSIGSKSLARTGGRFVPFVRGSSGVNVGS